jgi:hypothetical protein
MVLATLVAASAAALIRCAHAPSCDGLSCAAACPRDAVVDAAGRCACVDGDVSMLGACVPPPIAAAFCGPAASVGVADVSRATGGGCVFRSCGASESLDAVTGVCVARTSLPHGGSLACEGAAIPIVEDGRLACVPPDAACPRGTSFRADANAGEGANVNAPACTRPPACPAGTLGEGSSCRPIVTRGGRTGTRVDVGAWAALALGIDGGSGSPWLCRPLAQRPSLFAGDLRDARRPMSALDAGHGDGGPSPSVSGGAGGGADDERSASSNVRISVSATFPDEDVSRLHVDVRALDAAGHSLGPAAEGVAAGAVDTLFELLRGLGGEASAAAVGLEVTCAVVPAR